MVYRVLPGVSIGRLIYQGKGINGHGCTFYYDGDEDAYIDASAVEEAKQYIEDMVRTECQPLIDEMNRKYPPFGGK